MKKQQKNSHVLEPYARQVHVSAVEAGRTCSLRYTGADNVMFHCMVTDAADAGWRHITWKTHCTRNVTGEILALAMNIGSNLRF